MAWHSPNLSSLLSIRSRPGIFYPGLERKETLGQDPVFRRLQSLIEVGHMILALERFRIAGKSPRVGTRESRRTHDLLSPSFGVLAETGSCSPRSWERSQLAVRPIARPEDKARRSPAEPSSYLSIRRFRSRKRQDDLYLFSGYHTANGPCFSVVVTRLFQDSCTAPQHPLLLCDLQCREGCADVGRIEACQSRAVVCIGNAII